MPKIPATKSVCQRTFFMRVDFPEGKHLVGYSITRIPIDPCSENAAAWRFSKIDSDDHDSNHYVVTVNKSGWACCECRGYLGHNYCKHILVAEALAAEFRDVPRFIFHRPLACDRCGGLGFYPKNGTIRKCSCSPKPAPAPTKE